MKKKPIIIVCILFLLVISGFIVNTSADTSATYTVHRVLSNGTFGSALLTTTNFDEAYAKMRQEATSSPNVVVRSNISKSPLQIVAADRARVQSYPYRSGSTSAAPVASNTLKIFEDTSLSSRLTYIPAHYQMFYYETKKNGSSLVADVQINGVRGYVDINQIDIIPLLYFEQNLSLLLGGNENYYGPRGETPEEPYLQKVVLDYYDVVYDSSAKTYDIRVNVNRTYPSLSKGVTTFGIAPTWMPVGKYYSADGLTYYTDPELKNAVNNGKAYYSYYQWLPLRSQSNITAADLNYYITKIGYQSNPNLPKYSVIVGNEQKFVDAANKYGFNVLLLFSQAAIESTYGSSKYAVERYNLIGWNATDSNPNNATYFDSLDHFLERYLGEFLRGYLWISDWRNEGFSFGNKGSGIGVQYASDPYYGMKIAQISYYIDYNAGFKDFEKYQLALVDTSTSVELLKGKSQSSGTWYSIPAGRNNQVITVLENSSGYIKTNLSTPIRNGVIANEAIPVNLSEIIGYVSSTKVKLIDFKNGTDIGANPSNPGNPDPEGPTVTDQNKKYKVNTGDGTTLNLRSSWSSSSSSLARIPDGTVVTSTGIVSNGWIRINYNGTVGYISGDYAVEYTEPPIENPVMKGDLNGDGKITSIDGLRMIKYLAGEITLDTNAMKAADLNGDGKVTSIDGLRMIKYLANEIASFD